MHVHAADPWDRRRSPSRGQPCTAAGRCWNVECQFSVRAATHSESRTASRAHLRQLPRSVFPYRARLLIGHPRNSSRATCQSSVRASRPPGAFLSLRPSRHPRKMRFRATSGGVCALENPIESAAWIAPQAYSLTAPIKTPETELGCSGIAALGPVRLIGPRRTVFAEVPTGGWGSPGQHAPLERSHRTDGRAKALPTAPCEPPHRPVPSELPTHSASHGPADHLPRMPHGSLPSSSLHEPEPASPVLRRSTPQRSRHPTEHLEATRALHAPPPPCRTCTIATTSTRRPTWQALTRCHPFCLGRLAHRELFPCLAARMSFLPLVLRQTRSAPSLPRAPLSLPWPKPCKRIRLSAVQRPSSVAQPSLHNRRAHHTRAHACRARLVQLRRRVLSCASSVNINAGVRRLCSTRCLIRIIEAREPNVTQSPRRTISRLECCRCRGLFCNNRVSDCQPHAHEHIPSVTTGERFGSCHTRLLTPRA